MLFLPIVFFLYWQTVKNRQSRNALIVAASYVFYGMWDWRFLGLLIITTLCSYYAGTIIGHSVHSRTRRATLWASIAINLGILAVFKYFNFFADNMSELLSLVGYHPGWVSLNLVLPVGISFYTFQAIGYTVDVYNHRIKATHDMPAYFAFVSFFPQLVAGPIERAGDLLPQFERQRSFDYAGAVDGMRQMLWGFFKKMVVADNCAVVVNQAWARHDDSSGIMLAIAAVMFAFQIYGDFSGYSDIAVGCARLFGVRLSQNFNFPYFSPNIREFWRRWHISLMRWFTTYVYIPMGGSRVSQVATLRNIMIVFTLSGLWHGANWTYVLWGMYHGILVIMFRLVSPTIKATGRLWRAVAITLTFVSVTAGLVIFRAPSPGDALSFLSGIFTQPWADSELVRASALTLALTVSVVAITLMMTCEWYAMKRDADHALQVNAGTACVWNRTWLRRLTYVAIAMACCLLAGSQAQFIYFQF